MHLIIHPRTVQSWTDQLQHFLFNEFQNAACSMTDCFLLILYSKASFYRARLSSEIHRKKRIVAVLSTTVHRKVYEFYIYYIINYKRYKIKLTNNKQLLYSNMVCSPPNRLNFVQNR